MKKVFADAWYWIALLNPKDHWHEMAAKASEKVRDCRIVTSEMVLVEVLNALGGRGEAMRKIAAETVARLQRHPNVEIVPQTSLQFQSATERYASRPDKGWSATDCASFLLMEERNVSEALTNDQHFQQAGFRLLVEPDGDSRT